MAQPYITNLLEYLKGIYHEDHDFMDDTKEIINTPVGHKGINSLEVQWCVKTTNYVTHHHEKQWLWLSFRQQEAKPFLKLVKPGLKEGGSSNASTESQ